MAVEASLQPKKRSNADRLLQLAKQRAIDEYRKPFLEAMKRGSCHCHLPVAGGCKKRCEHGHGETPAVTGPALLTAPASATGLPFRQAALRGGGQLLARLG